MPEITEPIERIRALVDPFTDPPMAGSFARMRADDVNTASGYNAEQAESEDDDDAVSRGKEFHLPSE